MITWKEALENPELMIKYKDDLKDVKIFDPPWYLVFEGYPCLYREFSDRFDEMDGEDVSYALRDDPTLVSDLKEYLYKIERWSVTWLLRRCPELSLCIKYRDYPDKAEAAYYVLFPHELDNLNKKEKREIGKRIMEFLGEEKI